MKLLGDCSTENLYKVETTTDQQPMYVRPGAFLAHPESSLCCPDPWRFTFSRLFTQTFFWLRVNSGSFTLTTPFDDSRIVAIELSPEEAFFVKLDHVLAFTSSAHFNRTWKIDLTSLLTQQFRYLYFTGPGTLWVFGLGGSMDLRTITPSSEGYYDRGSVIGWTGKDLLVGVGTRSSLGAAALHLESILIDHFKGEGYVLTQASSLRKLPRRFNQGSSPGSLLDMASAVLGLRV